MIKWYWIAIAIAAAWIWYARKKDVKKVMDSAVLNSPLNNLKKNIEGSAKASGLVSDLAQSLIDGQPISQSSVNEGDFIIMKPLAERVFGTPSNSQQGDSAEKQQRKKVKRDQIWWPLNMHDLVPDWAKDKPDYDQAEREGRLRMQPCGCGCGEVTLVIIS
jgi:hypothetical protein